MIDISVYMKSVIIGAILLMMLPLTRSFICKSITSIQRTIYTNIRSQPLLQSYSPLGTPKPHIVHATIDNPKDRVLIVGDIHGCLDEFKLLLNKCNYDSSTTTLVLVGDLVNKGPYSVETIQYARELNAYCVRGNHDDSALSVALKYKNRYNKYDSYEPPAHYKYVEHLTDDDINWLSALPYTITIPAYKTLVVHAGLLPDKELHQQQPGQLYTIRSIKKKIAADNTCTLEGSMGGDDGEPWASYFAANCVGTMYEDMNIVFGHDAKRGNQQYGNVIGIDTACCYGRKLSGLLLPDKQIVSIDALRVYEEVGKVH